MYLLTGWWISQWGTSIFDVITSPSRTLHIDRQQFKTNGSIGPLWQASWLALRFKTGPTVERTDQQYTKGYVVNISMREKRKINRSANKVWANGSLKVNLIKNNMLRQRRPRTAETSGHWWQKSSNIHTFIESYSKVASVPERHVSAKRKKTAVTTNSTVVKSSQAVRL